MKKHFFVLSIFILLCFYTSISFAGSYKPAIILQVDERKALFIDDLNKMTEKKLIKPQNIKGLVFVPAKEVLEYFNFKVIYISNNKIINIYDELNVTKASISMATSELNSGDIVIKNAIIKVEGKILIQANLIRTIFDIKTDYDSKKCIISFGENYISTFEKYFTKKISNEGIYEFLKTNDFLKKETGGDYVVKRNAVIRYQASLNQKVTGKLEDIKQFAGEAKVATEDTNKELPKGYFIDINKTKNVLSLYFYGKLFKRYPIASGRNKDLTPEGNFKITNKAINPRWKYIPGGAKNNPLGSRWLGISVDNGGSYGIHGNASPTSIGNYASNGCIRMTMTDVEELYYYVPSGTPVKIHK